MSGALIDLVAQGVQDAYLTGNPEVSFFRQNYKRHTNFAQKAVRLDPNGNQTDINIKIPNKGDLLSYIWIDLGSDATLGGANSTAIAANTNNSAIFELWIGGQMVDRMDAFFMIQLWQKFLLDSGAKGMATQTAEDDISLFNSFLNGQWLPLHFFFCDYYALPLVALQYNEVEIRIQYAANPGAGSGPPSDFKYYANYILLDTDERAHFVNNDHEILIEQVQKIQSELPAATTANQNFNLGLLNHPVKCLSWGSAPATGNAFTTTDVQIYLNGNELFGSVMPDKLFTQVQGYYHSEFASELLKGDASQGGSGLKMYSFAMKANKHQPTGTCNFSRLDNASLTIGTTANPPSNFDLYAVNFNVFRIKKGMGGIAFAN
jgi:hypothetical protein